MQCRHKLCLLQCDHHLIYDQDMCHCYWPERKEERTTYGELSVTLVSDENFEDCIIRKLEVSENTPQTTIPNVRFEAQCRRFEEDPPPYALETNTQKFIRIKGLHTATSKYFLINYAYLKTHQSKIKEQVLAQLVRFLSVSSKTIFQGPSWGLVYN